MKRNLNNNEATSGDIIEEIRRRQGIKNENNTKDEELFVAKETPVYIINLPNETNGTIEKNIDGETFVMSHNGGNNDYCQKYPTYLDSSCHSRPIPNATNKTNTQLNEGRVSKIIDGETFVMSHNGGNNTVPPQYPSYLDSSCHSRPIQDEEPFVSNEPQVCIINLPEEHNCVTSKCIDGETYVMSHNGGNDVVPQQYPSYLDSSCHSRPITDTKQSSNESEDSQTNTR